MPERPKEIPEGAENFSAKEQKRKFGLAETGEKSMRGEIEPREKGTNERPEDYNGPEKTLERKLGRDNPPGTVRSPGDTNNKTANDDGKDDEQNDAN